MRKILLTVLMLALTGCLHTETMNKGEDDGSGMAPSFAQFSDIPIPEKASMDLKQTLLLGGASTWIGRLVFTTPYALNGMFDFYMAEMPKFGWKEVTVVRSKISVMSFTNKNRVATIQLEQDMVNGSIISFTVSPKTEAKTSAGL